MVSPPVLPLPLMVATDLAKRTGQCILIFDWELVLNERCSWIRAEGGCIMNLIDMVDESFFNFVMQLLGSASDAFDNAVKVKIKK